MPANYDQIPPERKNAYLENAEAVAAEAAADMIKGFNAEELANLDPRTMDLGKAALQDAGDMVAEHIGARDVVEGAEWLLREDDATVSAAGATIRAAENHANALRSDPGSTKELIDDAEEFANTTDGIDLDLLEMNKWEGLRSDLETVSSRHDANYYRSLMGRDVKMQYGVNWGVAGPPAPPTPEEAAKRAADDAKLMRRLVNSNKWRNQSPAPHEPSKHDLE